MKHMIVDGMHGLGDNLHSRSVIKQWMEHHIVWLETPWPSVYHDLVGERLHLLRKDSKLRTQAKNVRRERRKYTNERPPADAIKKKIWYTHPAIKAYGTFLQAMQRSCYLGKKDFKLPIPAEWLNDAQRLIASFRTTKPLLIYRPLVERTEWWNCAARNPDGEAYTRLLSKIKDRYFVVSLADLLARVEWISSPDIEADVEFHCGELPFETMAALVKLSSLVWCSPGFMPILAQSVGAMQVCVFGGWEYGQFYDHGNKTDCFINPVRPSSPFKKHFRYDKSIDIEAAEAKIERFIAWELTHRAA